MKVLFLRQKFDWVQDGAKITPTGMTVRHVDMALSEFFDDQRLSDLAEQFIHCEKPDVLVIPVFLGNPTDYNGFRLAMHVRLTEAPGFKQPHIVLLASESNDEFHTHCPYIRFLQTDKVSYVDYDHTVITGHLENLKLGTEEYQIENNLQYFDINKPHADDDHHNIDSKLALLNWSEAIGCIDELNHLRKRFGNQLHFKESALTTRHHVRITNETATTFREGKHKILLIDDKAEDGWSIFFQSLFSSSQINFSHLEFSSLSNNSEEIVKRASEQVSETDPDVIILDLRLCDSDAEATNTDQELTGIRILRKIKAFNRGIQVIVLSASNKIWNLKPAYDLGARECIVKNPYDRHALKQLRISLDESTRLYRFYKTIYTRLSRLKTLIQLDNNTSLGFKDSALNSLTVGYDLIEMSEVESNYINYAYLHLYKLIEDWVEEYTVTEPSKKRKKFSIIKGQKVDVLSGEDSKISYSINHRRYIEKPGKYSLKKPVDTNFKMSALLIYVLEGTHKNWRKVNQVRNNKCGHANQNKEFVTTEELLKLIDFLDFIFETTKTDF
ncbi:response regulator [Flavobacteriales bacterium]|nr:response regulator [Flavobacteriales bacterium]